MWIGGAVLGGIISPIMCTTARDMYMLYIGGISMGVIGGVSLISGIVIDVVYSGRESKLKRQLAEMGVAFNFTPVVTPDIVGNLQYGAQLGFTYKY